MNELLSRINETFDNCMANSNEDTKLQLRILKNNINALFAEYESNSVPVVPQYNQPVDFAPEIVENDYVPSEIEYEPDFGAEESIVEPEYAVETSIPEVVSTPVIEPVPVEVPTPSIVVPQPIPVQHVQPTMEEAFAPITSKHSILIVDDSSIVRNYLEKVYPISPNAVKGNRISSERCAPFLRFFIQYKPQESPISLRF